MPVGFIASGLGALASAGLIRGTLGKLLGKGATKAALGAGAAGTAISVFKPGVGFVGGAPLGGAVIRGGGAVIAAGGRVLARKWPKRILNMILIGAAFEVGDRIIDAITGKDITPTRRMNYANGRALKRAIRRFDGAAKQYAHVLKATKGGVKKCGYTVTAKKRTRRCA